MCITENKEVKLEVLMHSEIYNLTGITETQEYIGRYGLFGKGRPGRQDGDFGEALDCVEFCSGRSNKIAGIRQVKKWKLTREKHLPITFPTEDLNKKRKQMNRLQGKRPHG